MIEKIFLPEEFKDKTIIDLFNDSDFEKYWIDAKNSEQLKGPFDLFQGIPLDKMTMLIGRQGVGHSRFEYLIKYLRSKEVQESDAKWILFYTETPYDENTEQAPGVTSSY